MPVSFKPIVPKKKLHLFDPEKVKKGLRNYALKVQGEMQDYPEFVPWKSTPPKTGPRAGGKRTGAYGQRWSVQIALGGFKAIASNALYYAGFVGGYKGRGNRAERQTKVMAKRGWPSITDVAKKAWDKYLPGIKKSLQGGWE